VTAPATPRWQVIGGLLTVYVVWGSTYLAIRVMVETVPPLLGAGVRFVLAGALMLGALAARGRRGHPPPSRPARLSARELAAAAVVGTLLCFLGNGLVTVAERHVPSGLAALLIGSVPLWVVVLRSLAGDRPPRRSLLGVATGFGGLALLLLPGSRPSGAALPSALLVLFAAFCWACGSFASTRLSLPRDPLRSTGWQMLLGGGVMTVTGLAAGETGGLDPGALSGRSVAAFVYLVLIGSLVAFSAYVWLLQHAPISQVATYAYVNPVVAVALGWLVLGEEVTPSTLAGTAIVVGSVWWIVRPAPGTAAAADARRPAPRPEQRVTARTEPPCAGSARL
jgi:drug/metabolite transporter (DMT)-like permease